MIDFEQEIELHLREFQRWTGKGNVKDSNQSLYRIIRLMLGMIAQQSMVEKRAPPINSFSFAAAGALQPVETEVEGAHIEIDSISLRHPQTHQEVIDTSDGDSDGDGDHDHATPVIPMINAPHGLTRFGNPRRIRKR